MSRKIETVAFALLACLGALSVLAGEADVVKAEVSCTEERVCRFDVTVRHDDEGWDHYADKWEVLDPDGNVLAVRELAHPHVHEQPFTRSLDDVDVPAGLEKVVLRAHDSVHGHGGETVEVRLVFEGPTL